MSRARCARPLRDRGAIILVKGDRHELIFGRAACPGRPWLGLRGAEPAGRVHRHVHQPVRRHRGSAPARGHWRRGPAAAASARLASDLAALMDALGHERFAVAGHDTGMWIGYALAADHPGRVARLAVAETPLPGVSPSPPLFANAHLNNALWHFAFNRLAAVNDQLVAGREQIYFGWQFATKAAAA